MAMAGYVRQIKNQISANLALRLKVPLIRPSYLENWPYHFVSYPHCRLTT
jgi:hypothetical protein